jgi:ribosome biogenesis GTPase
MAMSVYSGMTLIEAQQIIGGDYSAFNWKDNIFYKKAYLLRSFNQAIQDAEGAIGTDEDKPAIIELLLKSEKMLVKDRVKRISGIKSARIVPEVELLKRTGYFFDSEKLIGLPEGIVTRASSGVYMVECETNRYRCSLRGKRAGFSSIQQVSVGDRVKVRIINANTGIIEAILRRSTRFRRKRTNQGKLTQKSSHTLVTNLDGLIIVAAAKDPPIWTQMLDTYLVISEASGITPLICVNKIDLAADRKQILSFLDIYSQIGYDTLTTSAITGEGIKDLKAWMKGKISVVVGLSGVGKSTLLNAIQPGLKLQTQKVNPRKGGRHTTVATELFKLDAGGFIADTSGIRELNLLEIDQGMMDRYFPEIRSLQQDCARNPCTHLHEEGCTVKAALTDGRIAKSRYQSYLELRKQKRSN